MIVIRLVMIGLLYSANSVASSNERRCRYVVVQKPPKEEPFAVHIEVKPKEVKEGLTQTASLRCSGPTDIDVTSIMITKRGSKVAMVTTDLAATIETAFTNIKVSGQTIKDKASPGQPFIELVWQLPSKSELQVRNKRILQTY